MLTALQQSLLDAAQADDAERVRGLLSGGVSLTTEDSFHGWTALHFAARYGSASVVQTLIELGAPLDPVDSEGFTPLALAVDATLDIVYQDAGPSDETIVRLLLDAGADPNVGGSSDATPIAVAMHYGSKEFADLLRQHR